jgi:glycosyltransferase involved in cell wall biosynthesis
MQNILFFVYRLYGGGAERVVSNLSLAFGDQYHIRIAIYGEQPKAYAHKGELIKIKLPYSGDPTANALWKRPIRLVVLMYKLRQIKRKHKIDVTISFGEQPNIINVLTRGKRKTILSVRSLLSKEVAAYPKMKVLVWFVKSLYNKAHQIIVTSKLAALDLSTHYGVRQDKIKVIYNYINQDEISRLASEPLDNNFQRELFQCPVLLNVGRITPAKGQWLLLRALKKITSLHPPFKLVLIGEAETEGNLMKELITLAGELGLKVFDGSHGQEISVHYDVFFLGFMANPFKFMMRSKMFVFPSVFEGFPNTILEAMQCGLPVISADCHSGPREIMAPESDLQTRIYDKEITEYGILCPALPDGDHKKPVTEEILSAWVHAIDLLANDVELRNRIIQNGYTRVREFDKGEILKQWQTSIEMNA